MITDGGEMKYKEFEKTLNPHYEYEENKVLLKSSVDKFEELGILEYVNEQKTYRLKSNFCESLESFIRDSGIQKKSALMLDEGE